MDASSRFPTPPHRSEAPSIERPVRVGDEPFMRQSYRFRGVEVRVVALMVPRVLDWLTDAFGNPLRREDWEQCLARVTPQGRITFGGSTDVEPLGVLQLCLMATPPFRGCPEKHIWDLHCYPHKAVCCEQWNRLIEPLTEALYNYLAAPDQWLQNGQRFAARGQDVLRQLRDYLDVYEVLRKRRLLKTRRTAFHKHKGIAGAYEAYLRARSNLEQRYRIDLSLAMGDAFRTVSYKCSYPDTAIDSSVTAILAHLGVEQNSQHDPQQGPLERITTRIASRRRPQRRRQR
jgi:hypothetical protein